MSTLILRVIHKKRLFFLKLIYLQFCYFISLCTVAVYYLENIWKLFRFRQVYTYYLNGNCIVKFSYY